MARTKKPPPDKPTLVAPGVTWLPSGKYQARIKMSATWTWIETFDTKDAAITERATMLVQRTESGGRRRPTTATVTQLLDEWLAWRKGDLGPTSVARYQTSIGHLGGAPFAGYGATELTVADVETWMAERVEAGRHPKTVNDEISPLSQAYDMALRRSVAGITFNPVRVARKTPVRRQQRLAVKLVAVQAIIDALPDARRIAGYLAFEVGLRRAEICGLTEDCLDFDAQTIRVYRQWGKRPGRGYGFSDLKNHRNRVVPVGNSKILTRVATHLLAQGGEPNVHQAVIVGDDGRPVSTQALTRTWQAAREATPGLPAEMEGWHILRHAFGSYHQAAGENPAEIARWMGHTLETFNRHYGRATGTAPSTDLAALAEQARDDAGTSARGKRVADGTTGGATIVDLGERRRNR